MTLFAPLWQQESSYSATLDRQLIDILFAAAGVVGGSDLAVTQRAAGSNMSVDVASGRCIVPGTDVANQGKYLCFSDAVTNVTIATAPGAGSSRIDLIVATVRDADADGGAFNDWIIQSVTGTPAGTPSAPAMPASSLLLATVAVGSSVTSIVNANIVSTLTPATSREWTPGDYKESASTASQPGWLYCDGSAVSRTTFAALFGKIGTTYGVGDGSTTFNIPDRRGRSGVGVGSVGTNAQPSVALAATGGEELHTLVQGELSVALGTATTVITDPQHSHPITGTEFVVGMATGQNNSVNSTPGGASGPTGVSFSAGTSNAGTGITAATTITNAGGGNAHNNMHPYIGVAVFIKT